MEYFQKILKAGVDGGASDVHIKIGTPIIYRINRELIAVDSPHPSDEWMNKVVMQAVPSHLHKRLDALTQGQSVAPDKMSPEQTKALKALQDYELRVSKKHYDLLDSLFDPMEEQIAKEMFARPVK